MKRHSSIFTLLLSAFAAVGSVARAENFQIVNGGYYFVEGKNYAQQSAKRMSIEGDGKSYVTLPPGLSKGETVTFKAVPEAGLRVAQWGTLINPKYATDGNKYESYTWTTSASDSKVWSGEPSNGDGYLAVNFKYIVYNVRYDANGGKDAPDSVNGKRYDEHFNLPSTTPTKSGFDFSGWKPDTKTDQIYSAGQEVSGVDLCSDDWHEDGKIVTLRAQWTGKPYTVTYQPENCTLTSQPSPGTYDQPLSIAWIKDADVGETSTVTVYDGKDTARQILQRTTNTTSFDFKMSDLPGTYYESVLIKVACTKNVRHDLMLNKGDGVKAITWKTNDCDWVRSETDVNLPGLLASTTWEVKVEEADVERGYDGPGPDSGNMSVDVTRTLKGTPHQYTIDYDLQPDGEKKPGGNYPVNATFDESFYVSAPTRTDRTFLGWIVVTNKDDLTCAKWGAASDDVTHEVFPETPCANGATGDVFFKNLTSIKGEKIWLKAKWSGLTRTITVTTDPKDAGSVTGGGEIDDGTKATLTATPNDGYSFCCWTNGNEVVSTDNPWTFIVTADETYTAVFTGNVYTVTFIAFQTSPKMISGTANPDQMHVTYGSPYGQLPTADYSDSTYALAGWYTGMNASGTLITEESIVTVLDDNQVLYGYAVPKETYTIAYDGNGATSGTMTNETALCGVETALTSNTYARTGYDFAGWTNTVKQAFYEDGAKVTDLASAKQTATLFAVWTPHTYTVRFDKTDADKQIQMPDQPFTYDVAQALSPNRFEKTGSAFLGWTTNGSEVIVYQDGESVSNLTPVANGLVTLFAKWGLANDLSIAADCAYARADGRQAVELTTPRESCAPVETEDVGGNGLAVRLMPTEGVSGQTAMMSAALTGPGILEFHYKTFISNDGSKLTVSANGGTLLFECATTVSTWTKCVVPLEKSFTYEIDWSLGPVAEKDTDFALIDNIRWIPGAVHPVPVDGKDNVTISSAAVSDGKFTLSFPFKEDFDYLLKTNANLLIDSWGTMEIEGTKIGEIMTFEPKIIEGQPQLFYKVETIQKR